MNTRNQDQENTSHSHSDPGRRRHQFRSSRKYSSSASESAAANNRKFTFGAIEYLEGPYRTPTECSDTHSLIRHAARSALLDDVTPTGSAVFSSGDASDDDEDYNNESGSRKPQPNIRSLEIASQPAIPDEQDRKRFVGCLAAVLSSMYDYESSELLFDKKDNINCSTNENENDVSGFFDFYESSDEESLDVLPSQRNGQESDNTENRPDTRKETIDGTTSLISAPSTDTTDNFYSRTCKSFESIGSSTTTAATSSTTNNLNNQNTSKKSILASSKLKPMSSFRRKAADVQKLTGINNNIADEKAKLSRQRYLSRRYELYSGLLLSSSELLLLDKSVARAFLPMLSRVLVPKIHQTHSKATDRNNGTTRTRTFQEGKQRSLSSTRIPAEEYEPNDGEDNIPIGVYRSPKVHVLDNTDELSPFLDSLTPGAGFRCVSLLLLQHLLTSENGYDSRIRHALKKLSILVLGHDMDNGPTERDLPRNANMGGQEPTYQSQVQQSDRGAFDGYTRRSGVNENDEEDDSEYDRRKILQATRKFEALEQNIARRLILLSSPARNRKSKTINRNGGVQKEIPSGGNGITREQIVRGVKIGGAGILAGTLFAVTGGIAAPGIAAGVAAVAGAAAGTAAVSALTSTAVVTTIFGVGGGGLAAYKMQRRTQGVTEFEFCRETKGRPDRCGPCNSDNSVGNDDKIEAELFSILCISGWLRDQCDYQRPWGLQPTHPRISDRLERLERFYSIYSPSHIPKCERILSSWKGEENELWEVLREKYGRDPDHLFPLNGVDQKNGPECANSNGQGQLTPDQEEILDKLFIELGYHSVAPEKKTSVYSQHEKQLSPFERMRNGWKNRRNAKKSQLMRNRTDDKFDPNLGSALDQVSTKVATTYSNNMQCANESQGVFLDLSFQHKDEDADYKPDFKPPKHLSTVWDWKTTYGGEMYTVKWESTLLTQICDCVTDLAVDVVSGATRQLLKQTVLHTLLSAVVWPSYLLNLAHMIDGDWTIAVERADEAGVVLAKTLLYSRAGRRPVTLVGYSFGARIIYSCLKELARYQEEWEHYREILEETGTSPEGGYHHKHGRLAKYKQKMKGMREPASIVEDAILLGLPNHLSLSSWKACRQIVAGRLVNCYSKNDLILSLMFQAKRFSGGSLNHGVGSILKPVCGTCPVEEAGIENVDCSDLILGHQDYCLEIGKILQRIGLGEAIRLV